MTGKFELLNQIVSKYGVGALCYLILSRTINSIFPFKTFEIIYIDQLGLDQEFLNLPDGYSARFVSYEELSNLGRNDPTLDLSENFLKEAQAKGDNCYAIFENKTLAAYGWYSTKSTSIDHQLTYNFNPNYAYMYKGFTALTYRGKRLHAIGMARSLKEHTSMGIKGFVSYVEKDNFASLKSVYRMGYKKVGFVIMLRILGRWRFWHSSGCKEFGVTVSQSTSKSAI